MKLTGRKPFSEVFWASNARSKNCFETNAPTFFRVFSQTSDSRHLLYRGCENVFWLKIHRKSTKQFFRSLVCSLLDVHCCISNFPSQVKTEDFRQNEVSIFLCSDLAAWYCPDQHRLFSGWRSTSTFVSNLLASWWNSLWCQLSVRCLSFCSETRHKWQQMVQPERTRLINFSFIQSCNGGLWVRPTPLCQWASLVSIRGGTVPGATIMHSVWLDWSCGMRDECKFHICYCVISWPDT